MNKRWSRAVSVCLVALGGTVAAQANTSTYIFQVTGEAKAVITVNTAGTINVTLYDLYVNPNSVADNLSAFWFTASGTTGFGASPIASSSADSIDVIDNGTYSDKGTVAPGWAPTFVNAVTKLDDLGAGGSGPAHTIIGAPDVGNVYDGAGGSIAKTGGPHDNFLNQSATWTLNETGITSSTTISSVTFQFGTTDGSNTISTDVGTVVATPEPASAGLFIFGGISLLLMGRKSLLRSR
jgi:hypothetical protein